MTAVAINHRGSLMTVGDGGRERCLGYLLDAPGHGVFEPTLGKLEIASTEASTHNQLLSRAEIEGLDSNCAVGMSGMFYVGKQDGQSLVKTWVGESVSNQVQIHGRSITFHRKGMIFRGRLRNDQDCFAFKRIQ